MPDGPAPSQPARHGSLSPPQPLGVGLAYFGSLSPSVYDGGLLDFVEITPETLCRQRTRGGRVELELVPERLERARVTCDSLPIVVHGVELSIGSAFAWNGSYLDMLDRFQAAWPFAWHSEHLSFQTIPDENGVAVEIGVPLPLPPTCESVSLVAQRAAAILARYGVPFLLENPAHYLTNLPVDPEIGDEIELMARITGLAACGQLLDLHNLYCNAVNHQFDPIAAIDRIPLDRVLEIHVAGGSLQAGFWMDAHDGPVPEPVWELLEYTLPRARNVAGIVFEMLEEHVERLGPAGIVHQLARAREYWRRFRRP